MKRGFNILVIISAALCILSCSKTKSYTDMLKDERKAIERLRDDEGLVFLKEFPKDSVFKENEFFKLSNEVYINIVDRGGDKKAELGTNILARFEASYFMSDTTSYITYGPNSNGTYPTDFVYGNASASSGTYSFLLSEGFQTGLQYVGHKGKVKLIVPFKRGTTSDMQYGKPIYFRMIEYKFAGEL